MQTARGTGAGGLGKGISGEKSGEKRKKTKNWLGGLKGNWKERHQEAILSRKSTKRPPATKVSAQWSPRRKGVTKAVRERVQGKKAIKP